MANDSELKGKNNEDNKHRDWIDNLAEKVHKLDTEFPLSGGETEEDLDLGGNDVKTSFFEDLDTEFPLSGGETER